MTSRGGRLARRAGGLLAWLLVVLVGLAALASLAVFGTVWWYTEVTWPERRRETAAAELALAREHAQKARTALAAAVADGDLTDPEIRAAVGGPIWTVDRSAPRWTVLARIDGTDPVCFTFEITPPLGPGTPVTHTELPACPAITPGG